MTELGKIIDEVFMSVLTYQTIQQAGLGQDNIRSKFTDIILFKYTTSILVESLVIQTAADFG